MKDCRFADCMERQKAATLVGEKSQEDWFGAICNNGKPIPLRDDKEMMGSN